MRITVRLQLIKYTILLGLLASVLLSLNLWCGQRWFPKAPLIEGLRLSEPPYDYINLGVLLLLIVAAFIIEARWIIVLFILFSVYLVFDDQNRLQPWFFNYWLMLLVLLCYKKRVDDPNNYITVFICLQVLVALVYIYSGIQKLNSRFIPESYTWFIEPLKAHVSERQQSNLLKFGSLVPYIETALGIGLLVKPIRFIVVPLVVLMHVFIILMLGPAGQSYNHVVWPWNLAMIALCLLLFNGNTRERYYSPTYLLNYVCFYVMIGFMLAMPFFSLANKWPSYLSSSLYSGNTDSGNLILSNKAYERLPLYIRIFVTKNDDYNILYVKRWCITELKTPCYPEKAVFDNTRKYIINLTNTSPEDVKIEFIEREKLIRF